MHPSATSSDCIPAVTTPRRDPPKLCPTMHRTELSDTHSVASHPVCPSRALNVYPALPPMLPPCTVIDAPPAPTTLIPTTTLIPAPSTDHASVTLPDCIPAVTTPRRDPPKLCPTMHRTELSDTHSVASHPVCPSRALNVYPALPPMLPPCTVIDAPPAPTTLIPTTTLIPAPSTDHA